MFGNPLEDGRHRPQTLQRLEGLSSTTPISSAPTCVAGFTGRIRGKPLTDSLPRYSEVWGGLAKRAADKGVKIAFENCAMDGNWATRRLEHRAQSRRLGADVQRDCRTTISGSNGSPATSWSI